MKLYFNDREFQAAGFSAAMINTMRRIAEFIDTQTDVTTNTTNITTLVANDAAMDARLDTVEARSISRAKLRFVS